MVLTIHVVRPGGHRYYVDDLVPGRAEGTLVAGEEPGTWIGTPSASLGLAGPVDAPRFAALLDGRHPQSGRPLRHPRSGASVSGYDLTFCAPKSVSVLHLLAPREIATQTGAGHQAAVEDAVSYLSRRGVGVRRTEGGQTAYLRSTGMLAGQFLHRTSRALDPHLHTHVVAANLAQGVDGRWSAVDSRRLYAHLHAAQGIYHARLRLELGNRLGAGWEVRTSGLGEVTGVDRHLRRLFSQRTASMDEYDQRRGRSSTAPQRSRGAFHATRPEKERDHTVDSLTADWKERAASFGFDLGDLTRVVGLGREMNDVAPGPVDVPVLRTQLGRLGERRRTVTESDLVASVAGASLRGATARQLEAVASTLVEATGTPEGTDQQLGGAFDGQTRWRSSDLGRVASSLPAEKWSELRAHGPEDGVDLHQSRTHASGVDRSRERERAGVDHRSRVGHGNALDR